MLLASFLFPALDLSQKAEEPFSFLQFISALPLSDVPAHPQI